MNPPDSGNAASDERSRVHLVGSKLSFAESQLDDLFYAPDWFPRTHGPMPDIVARGRAPEVYACGYCHSPSGQGRPENSSLAGLSAAYIEQQVADFKSGARRSPWRGPYRPQDLMSHVATFADAAEVTAAARYFSQQRLRPRVRVMERARVPQSQVVGWVYATAPGGADQALGERLLEFAPDPKRHESRDDTLRYVAYVPVGSIGRGRSLATRPISGCDSCHGPTLKGVGVIPSLAGRSPSYLLRQLVSFKVGARQGAAGAPMIPVAAGLQLGDMIDAAAYAASLPP
jgi:cytochrome c553